MDRNNFDGLCAYMGSLWGRELSNLQRAGGWKMVHGLPNEAVESAVVVIAESGREQLPPWPVVYKTAQTLADAIRERAPALPASDSLGDAEHAAVMISLRAKQSPEQRRRADRVTRDTKGLPMLTRLSIARRLLADDGGKITDPERWDAFFDEVLAKEFQLTPPIQRGLDIHA